MIESLPYKKSLYRFRLPYPYNPLVGLRTKHNPWLNKLKSSLGLASPNEPQPEQDVSQDNTSGIFTPQELAQLTRIVMENMEYKGYSQMVARNMIVEQVTKLNKYRTNLLPQVNTLHKIFKKQVKYAAAFSLGDQSSPPKVDDIYNLAISIPMLTYGYSRIKSNTGSTTGGVTGESADSMSQARILALHQKLKNRTFKWRPLNRTLIPKPGSLDPATGKPKQRPIDVPEFDDRVLQASILTVLEAIYEPWFEAVDLSFGFRPYKSPADALEHLKTKGRGAIHAVEGDIKRAFNFVEPDTFIEIMGRHIKDKKFLELIRQAFKCGVHMDGMFTQTDLGTPQGGIASPMFFNIYLHEFDKFVRMDLLATIQNLQPANAQPKSLSKAQIELNKAHRLVRSTQTALYRAEARWKQAQKDNNQEVAAAQLEQYNKMVAQEKAAKAVKMRLQQQTQHIEGTKQLSFAYARYADDWIILTTGNSTVAGQVKDLCKDYLSNKLKLTLSEEKTKITNITETPALFLGFTIFRKAYKRAKKLDVVPIKTSLHRQQAVETAGKQVRKDIKAIDADPEFHARSIYRTAADSSALSIGIDQERILKRWVLNNTVSRISHSPREMPAHSLLEIPEIIIYYNQRMLGLAQYYYKSITKKYLLNYYLYLLYYSCLKTLATKLRISISAITEKYSYYDVSPLRLAPYNSNKRTHQKQRIVYQYTRTNSQNELVPKFVVLYNYRDVMARCAATEYNSMFTKGLKTIEINFLTAHKKYWRTQFKLTACCQACGSTGPLQMHHIKKLKGKNTAGFGSLLSQLNRKQIALCHSCHHNVHRGLYNGMSLNDLWSYQMVQSEGLIRYTDPDIPNTLKWDNPTQQPKILTRQVRFSSENAYHICDNRKRIVSKYICAYEHGFELYKRYEYRFNKHYYNSLTQRSRNIPLDLK